MKRLFITVFCFGFISCVFLCGCSKKEKSADVEKLLSERDSLLQVSNMQNQKLKNMNSYFTEISDCLDSITEQEQILLISVNPETNRKYSSVEMRQRLKLLSGILNRQRERIKILTDSLYHTKDSAGYQKLSKLVDYLSQQLDEKEARIKSLVSEVTQKNMDIAKLTDNVNELKTEVSEVSKKNEMLSTAVVEQTKMLNQAHVLMGDKKRLQDLGILTKGNLLKKSKFTPDNINLGYCETIDISKVRKIPLYSKKPKILSPVPNSSYKITETQDGGKMLVINDPTTFWSLSNILVIQL
ncbi:MAG: hypothetical protein K2G13_04405 [Muribaculaceae bacterium]|nr:hypothetical protein [Muribaculaceae bacterium]